MQQLSDLAETSFASSTTCCTKLWLVRLTRSSRAALCNRTVNCKSQQPPPSWVCNVIWLSITAGFHHQRQSMRHLAMRFSIGCSVPTCTMFPGPAIAMARSGGWASSYARKGGGPILSPMEYRMCSAPVPQAADAVFCRLILDVQLSRRVQRKARSGRVNDDARENAEILEREAFRVLANYCEARAFVQSEDGL